MFNVQLGTGFKPDLGSNLHRFSTTWCGYNPRDKSHGLQEVFESLLTNQLEYNDHIQHDVLLDDYLAVNVKVSLNPGM